MRPPNEQRIERRLAAIFAADVAGYSRLISQDEAATLRALAAAREVMDGLIRDHGGRIANTAGDSLLAEFPSAVDAVQCAVVVQEELREVSAVPPYDRRLEFRIGVHVGDVVVRGGDLLGDGVSRRPGPARRIRNQGDPLQRRSVADCRPRLLDYFQRRERTPRHARAARRSCAPSSRPEAG